MIALTIFKPYRLQKRPQMFRLAYRIAMAVRNEYLVGFSFHFLIPSFFNINCTFLLAVIPIPQRNTKNMTDSIALTAGGTFVMNRMAS